MKNPSYSFIFVLSGALLISIGTILSLNAVPIASGIFWGLGTSTIAVVIINFLWFKSGGEPVQNSLNELLNTSKLFSDGIETGIRRVYPTRSINYEHQHKLISNAKDVSIMSLVFKVAQSQELKKSFKDCIRNNGNIRILISDPELNSSNNDIPSPFFLRQFAEGDTKIHSMHSDLLVTIKYLNEIRNDIELAFPDRVDQFEFRILPKYVMYFSMTQIDNHINISHYTNKRRGVDAPTFSIDSVDHPKSLFKVYSSEFEYLWKKAKVPVLQENIQT